jgi:hypothetical protein
VSSGATGSGDLGAAIRLLKGPTRQRLEETHRAMLAAAPVDDAVLVDFVTRLELTGFLPLGCSNRIVQLVAIAGTVIEP